MILFEINSKENSCGQTISICKGVVTALYSFYIADVAHSRRGGREQDDCLVQTQQKETHNKIARERLALQYLRRPSEVYTQLKNKYLT